MLSPSPPSLLHNSTTPSLPGPAASTTPTRPHPHHPNTLSRSVHNHSHPLCRRPRPLPLSLQQNFRTRRCTSRCTQRSCLRSLQCHCPLRQSTDSLTPSSRPALQTVLPSRVLYRVSPPFFLFSNPSSGILQNNALSTSVRSVDCAHSGAPLLDASLLPGPLSHSLDKRNSSHARIRTRIQPISNLAVKLRAGQETDRVQASWACRVRLVWSERCRAEPWARGRLHANGPGLLRARDVSCRLVTGSGLCAPPTPRRRCLHLFGLPAQLHFRILPAAFTQKPPPRWAARPRKRAQSTLNKLSRSFAAVTTSSPRALSHFSRPTNFLGSGDAPPFIPTFLNPYPVSLEDTLTYESEQHRLSFLDHLLDSTHVKFFSESY